MKYATFILEFLCCVSLCAAPAKVNPFFNKLSVNDGLSHNVVYCIEQDCDGFMWFGTSNGLCRYDGYRMTRFISSRTDTLATISDNLINCCVQDKNGNIWAGTSDGLNRISIKNDKIYRYLPEHYIKSLCCDDRGRLWIGSDEGLYIHLIDGDFEEIPLDGILKGTRVYEILQDRQGDIWITTRNAGLIWINPKTMEYRQYLPIPGDNTSITSAYTYSLLEDSAGRLWVGTWDDGVNILDRKSGTFSNIRADVNGGSIASNQIRCLAEYPSGTIWIGTNQGIDIYNVTSGCFTHNARRNGVPGSLSSNIIQCAMTDRTGSLWIGTNGGGVNLYNPKLRQFSLLDPKILAGHDFGTIGPMVEADGRIWIGNEGGGLSCYDPQSGKYLSLGNSLPASEQCRNIRALCKEDDGSIWIGTNASGIYHFYPKTMRAVHHEEPDGQLKLDNAIINEIYSDSHGRMWIGTNGEDGLLVRDKDGRSFSTAEGSFPFIRAIIEADDGSIWTGSFFHGLFIYRPDGSEIILNVDNSSLSSNLITCLSKDSSGNIWVGTNGGGVNIFDPVALQGRTLDMSTGLPDNNICSITHDLAGKAWITTLVGISSLDKETGHIRNHLYSRGNFPVETANFKSSLLSSDGTIYIGGTNGVAAFRPSDIIIDARIPPVALTGLMINDVPVSPAPGNILENRICHTDKIKLAHNQSDISFSFSCLDYIQPNNCLYSWMLTGHDDQWSSPSHSTTASYSNLRPGKYTFHVRACSDSAVWNLDGAKIQVSVAPPFYASWWAWFIYSAIFCFVMYSAVVYFKKRLSIFIAQKTREPFENAEDYIRKLNRIREHRYKILLAMNNEGTKSLLQRMLSNEYDILEGLCSEKSSALVTRTHPDMIISDITMPDNSALAFLSKIKGDKSTCQIPVILLGDGNSNDQEREALLSGADAYFVKPFNPDTLKIKVAKLIDMRRRLKGEFMREMGVAVLEKEEGSEIESFSRVAYDYVLTHMGDSINVNDLATHMNLSRAQLFRKIKESTGLSPVAFINGIRMRMAAELLRETHMTITEIASRTGYYDPSHFAVCFKREFGVSPSQYRSKNSSVK